MMSGSLIAVVRSQSSLLEVSLAVAIMVVAHAGPIIEVPRGVGRCCSGGFMKGSFTIAKLCGNPF